MSPHTLRKSTFKFPPFSVISIQVLIITSLILNMVAYHETEIETFEQQLAYLDTEALATAPEAVPGGRKDSEAVEKAKNARKTKWN